MIEHLNYCRHIVKQLSDPHPENDDQTRKSAIHVIDLAKSSKKFILPVGGVVLEDYEFRALNGINSIRLPYQSIALEFNPGGGIGNKFVIFATENSDSSAITVFGLQFRSEVGYWEARPEFHIPIFQKDSFSNSGKWSPSIDEDKLEYIADKKYAIKASVVLFAFLNALACSNVHITKSEPRKAGKKIKSALPFDTYHVLAIDVPGRIGDVGAPIGSHRSPREHLRRGHIRRLADCRRIWVNATVVAAGHGAGVVKKDYALRMAA